MLKRLRQSAIQVATSPFVVLGHLAHRWATGPKAIVEVRIESTDALDKRDALRRALRAMATDAGVAAVVLTVADGPGNIAALQRLREAITAIRESGKRTIAVLEEPGNAAMWLASAAEEVVISPTAQLGLVGLGVELTFLGEALSRLGVEPDFEAAGEYKSFGEPFTRRFPSAPNREATHELLEGLQGELLADVASARGLDRDALADALARAPLSAQDARELGLVDRLDYRVDVVEALEEELGEQARVVDFESYARRVLGLYRLRHARRGGETLAVVHLQGPIVMDDDGSSRRIRAKHVVPELEELRDDDDIVGVVLHIDSPGGSAIASDLVWHAVKRLADKVPVVACMEGVAASGGFYIAAGAHEILAEPTTLTGSIGVFGGKVVLADAFRHAGLRSEEVAVAPNANMFSALRPFDDDQRRRFRASLQRTYDEFVERVASQRGKEPDQVEVHCRGRVWTGAQAEQRDLVDGLGGLDAALERVAQLADRDLRALRRLDVVPQPSRGLGAWLLRNAWKSFGSGGALTRALSALLPGADLARVVLAHSSQALALWPFEVRLR